MFHLLQKMASNKVQTVLVAGWSGAGGEHAGSKEEQIPSQQQPSVVLQWPWDTNPHPPSIHPPSIVLVNVRLLQLFVGETQQM